MYAIIVAGASQHKVVEGERLRVDLMAGKKKGDVVVFDRVLMIGADDKHQVGTPQVAGASVKATVVDMGSDGEGVKGEKIWSLRRFPGKYKKHRGHRQRYTTIRIDQIKAG